jgi:hypothetical protein
MRSATAKFRRHRLKIAVGQRFFPSGALRAATLKSAAPPDKSSSIGRRRVKGLPYRVT